MNSVTRSLLLALSSVLSNTWTAQQNPLLDLPLEINELIFNHILCTENQSVLEDIGALRLTCKITNNCVQQHPALNIENPKNIPSKKPSLLCYSAMITNKYAPCFKALLDCNIPEEEALDRAKKLIILKKKFIVGHSDHNKQISLMEDLLNCTSNPYFYDKVMNKLILRKKMKIIQLLVAEGFPSKIKLKLKRPVDLLRDTQCIKRRTFRNSLDYPKLEQVEKIFETGNTLSDSFFSFGKNDPADVFSLYGPCDLRNLAHESFGPLIPTSCSIQ